jgi:hypothetical protein
MTDLQTSLIGIGGAIVVGVVAYNKWHEYKVRKNVERAFSSGPDDVLMTPPTAKEALGERQEPTFDTGLSGLETALSGRTEPVFSQEGAAETKSAPPLRELPLDPSIDCIIPLEPEELLRGEKILPMLQSLRHIGNKPVSYIGLAEGMQGSDGEWQVIAHGGIYTKLQAGVQLANRSGALNELEYSELVMRLRQIADSIAAEPDVPDMLQVMQAARTLYQFVSDHDARLSVNVRSKGAPWALTTIITALERQGFDLRPDGNFVMQDGEGGILYFLSTNVTPASENTLLLTLLLDVPCAAPQSGGYAAMVACAKSLCQRLDGTLVDDGGQPLSDAVLEEIGGQVNEFYQEMQAAEIPAGSNRALRLFVR